MHCRCCESEFKNTPILQYKDVPGMAQHFPTQEQLSDDVGENLDLFQCPLCGMLQLFNEPVSYYKDVIRASAVSEEMRVFRVEYFRKFFQEYGLLEKKILEIGAGCGEFLELINQAGGQGYGVEHCKDFVEICKMKGLRVAQGYMEAGQPSINGGPFDGFVIMNFLEHAPAPNEFLKKVYQNLADGAIGLIEVPNVDMILKKKLFSEFMKDHLLYFTEDTLRQILSKNGFEIIDCYPVWHEYCLAAIVRKRSVIDMRPFYQAWEDIACELNHYIDEVNERKQHVAIWGAGHQALTIISLCRIGRKIKFVIDSAEFKQEKYTPGSHVKVVSPRTLAGDPDIGAVIVMAASYSDEVAGILRKDYPRVKVAILREYGLEYV